MPAVRCQRRARPADRATVAAASPSAVLQRRIEGGRWTRTSTPVLFPSGQPMTVVTPVYAASGATALREGRRLLHGDRY